MGSRGNCFRSNENGRWEPVSVDSLYELAQYDDDLRRWLDSDPRFYEVFYPKGKSYQVQRVYCGDLVNDE